MRPADLQRVMLKKGIGPKAAPTADVARERELQGRLRSVDLEAWYPALEHVTFRTVLVPLSQEEARAMMAV